MWLWRWMKRMDDSFVDEDNVEEVSPFAGFVSKIVVGRVHIFRLGVPIHSSAHAQFGGGPSREQRWWSRRSRKVVDLRRGIETQLSNILFWCPFLFPYLLLSLNISCSLYKTTVHHIVLNMSFFSLSPTSCMLDTRVSEKQKWAPI